MKHSFVKACPLVRYQGVEVELLEIKQCVKEGDDSLMAKEKISFWQTILERTFRQSRLNFQAILEKTFRIPMATFATIFLLLGICGNDTMVFYGPTIASQVKKFYSTHHVRKSGGCRRDE